MKPTPFDDDAPAVAVRHEADATIRPDVPMATYLAWPEYGSSSLRAFRNGPPAMVPWLKANPDEQTDATRIGTAAHMKILQPDLFARSYCVKPEGMTFASKEGKAWRDDPCRKGLEILSHAEAVQIEQIDRAFYSKRLAAESLKDAGIEQSILWTCADSGLRCKSRPDWFGDDAVYDLKISVEATKGSRLPFRAYLCGWYHQLAHGRAALNAAGLTGVKYGRLVVIAPRPPQGLRVYCAEVKEAVLDLLELENVSTRKAMKACEDSGVWPDTGDEWAKWDIPAGITDTIVAMTDIEEVE